MPFPFRDNDDDLSRWDDPDPVECCRHEIPVDEQCPLCAMEAWRRFHERFGSRAEQPSAPDLSFPTVPKVGAA